MFVYDGVFAKKYQFFKLHRFLDNKLLNLLVFWQMLFFNFLILKLKD